MNEKRIGKIQSATFGEGGYQDAMVGLSVTLGSDKDCWGVGDFRGPWAIKRSENAKWTEQDRIQQAGEMVMWVNDILKAAKKRHVAELVGVPVEVEFDGMVMKSWRVLTEVI
jgi:hypothetical protein